VGQKTEKTDLCILMHKISKHLLKKSAAVKFKVQIVLARLSDQRASQYSAIRQAMPVNDLHKHLAMPLADPSLASITDYYKFQN